ncbi:MAG TPA: hypothetical protein VJM80_02780 [bacterium]|nr:hypothetical protein [bacterium]
MKRGIIAVAVAAILAAGTLAYAQGFGYGRGNGPGYGMMRGGMMGDGMMGGNWGAGSRGFGGPGTGYAGDHHCWQATSATATGQPLTKEQAATLVQNRLTRHGNPNLKVGNVTEKDGLFEVEIVTKDNSLVEKVQINKQTGWTQRAF